LNDLNVNGNNFTKESIQFQRKATMAYGIEDMTYASALLLKDLMNLSMDGGRGKAEATI